MIYTIHNLTSGEFAPVRQEVAEFAVAMEAKLSNNDHKTGWHGQPIEAHIKLLRIEMMELDVALDHLGDEAAAKECIDVANFALIIRDKLLARMKAAPPKVGDTRYNRTTGKTQTLGVNEEWS